MKPEEIVYLFALCSPDRRFPKIMDWYLKIIKEDRYQIATVMENLKSVLDVRFGHNRHYFNPHTKEPTFDLSPIFHPDVLVAQWIALAIELIDKYGVVYVAINGCMFPPDPEKFIEHSTRSLPVLAFPTDVPDEWITVHKWPGGMHFYLASSINRIFQQEKYNTMQEAINDAFLFVPKERVTFNFTADSA